MKTNQQELRSVGLRSALIGLGVTLATVGAAALLEASTGTIHHYLRDLDSWLGYLTTGAAGAIILATGSGLFALTARGTLNQKGIQCNSGWGLAAASMLSWIIAMGSPLLYIWFLTNTSLGIVLTVLGLLISGVYLLGCMILLPVLLDWGRWICVGISASAFMALAMLFGATTLIVNFILFFTF